MLVASIAYYALTMFFFVAQAQAQAQAQPQAHWIWTLLLIVTLLAPTTGVVGAIRLFLKDRRGYLWALGFFIPQILSYAGEINSYRLSIGFNFSMNVPGLDGFRMSISAIAFSIFCVYCFFESPPSDPSNRSS